MAGRRSSAFAITIVALSALAALSFVPTPYYLISPGAAVDLSHRIVVEGYVPPHRRFYMTDVAVTRASALTLLAGLWPGIRIVHRDTLFPPGSTIRDFERFADIAMGNSQHVAAYVAERAAGLHVRAPAGELYVAGIVPSSHALGVLRVGDRIVAVGARRIAGPTDISGALAHLRSGAAAQVEVARDGRIVWAGIPTLATDRGPRLGIYFREEAAAPALPVSVRYSIDDVGGSSGGLMFALAIYAALTGDRRGPSAVAGTGTIATDGSVGPVEGAPQKLIAAKRAGAALFLVPQANYRDVAGERDIAIVPVGSFAQALAVLR